MNSGVLWHVQLATGQQFEGVDHATLQQWMAAGRISPDDMLWRDGWPHWQSAITVFPHWNGSRAAVPPSSLPMSGVTPQAAPMTVRPVDDPLGDAVRSTAALPASATWLRQRHRGKREIRATLSLVLLGLVILLFALLLYVFFGREQAASKQTSLRLNAVFAAAFQPRYLPDVLIQRHASTNASLGPAAGFS
ncbi:MAG TPA: hypothetical protein VMJ32_05210 [Pirellulales bacterium]|nr:hypothetical protein [Pirellulales bacterium]